MKKQVTVLLALACTLIVASVLYFAFTHGPEAETSAASTDSSAEREDSWLRNASKESTSLGRPETKEQIGDVAIVRVLGPDGAPLVGMRISVIGTDGSESIRGETSAHGELTVASEHVNKSREIRVEVPNGEWVEYVPYVRDQTDSAHAVLIRIPPVSRLEGRVVDSFGNPIPNASVSLRQRDSSAESSTVTDTATGAFQFDTFGNQVALGTIRVTATGYVAESVDASVLMRRDPRVIRLSPGLTVNCQVRSNEPHHGGIVEVLDLATKEAFSIEVGAGASSLEVGPVKGASWIQLRAWFAGFEPFALERVFIGDVAHSGLELRLVGRDPLVLRLRGLDDDWIGARMQICTVSQEGEVKVARPATLTKQEAVSFDISHEDGDMAWVAINRPGRVYIGGPVAIESGELMATVPPARPVLVMVRDDGGQPVPGATVGFSPSGAHRTPDGVLGFFNAIASAATESDGTCEVRIAHDDNMFAVAIAPAGTFGTGLLRVGDERCEIVLSVRRSISGRVSRTDGDAIPGVLVRVRDGGGRVIPGTPQIPDSTSRGAMTACVTNAAGEFIVEWTAGHRAGLTFDAPGFESQLLVVDASSGSEARSVTLQEATNSVTGMVVDEYGRSVPWATVWALVRLRRGEFTISSVRSAIADEAGRFGLRGLPANAVAELTATSGGSSSSDVTVDLAGHNVETSTQLIVSSRTVRTVQVELPDNDQGDWSYWIHSMAGSTAHGTAAAGMPVEVTLPVGEYSIRLRAGSLATFGLPLRIEEETRSVKTELPEMRRVEVRFPGAFSGANLCLEADEVSEQFNVQAPSVFVDVPLDLEIRARVEKDNVTVWRSRIRAGSTERIIVEWPDR